MPSMGRRKSVWFLRETEGIEQKEEDEVDEEEDEEDEEGVRRLEQTKKEKGLVEQHGGWMMRGTSLFAVNRAKRVT